MQGTQSYQLVGSVQSTRGTHHPIISHPFWKSSTDTPGGEHHADAGLDLLHRLCHLYGETVAGDGSRCGFYGFSLTTLDLRKEYISGKIAEKQIYLRNDVIPLFMKTIAT